MPNKTFLVRLRTNALQHVRATTVEIHGDHLVFVTAKGKLAALFMFSIVESWTEIELKPAPPITSLSAVLTDSARMQ